MQTDITIYHLDKISQKYSKKSYKGVWQQSIGVSFNDGYTKSNKLDVYLFYKDNNLKFEDFSNEDIIVKGKQKNIESENDIKEEYFKIQTLIDNNYGSSNVRHIQIGAN